MSLLKSNKRDKYASGLQLLFSPVHPHPKIYMSKEKRHDDVKEQLQGGHRSTIYKAITAPSHMVTTSHMGPSSI